MPSTHTARHTHLRARAHTFTNTYSLLHHLGFTHLLRFPSDWRTVAVDAATRASAATLSAITFASFQLAFAASKMAVYASRAVVAASEAAKCTSSLGCPRRICSAARLTRCCGCMACRKRRCASLEIVTGTYQANVCTRTTIYNIL